MSSSLSLLPSQQFEGAVSSRKRQIRGPERSRCDKKGDLFNIVLWSEILNHSAKKKKTNKQSVVKAGWDFNHFTWHDNTDFPWQIIV